MKIILSAIAALSASFAVLFPYLPWFKDRSAKKRRAARIGLLIVSLSCVSGFILSIYSFQKPDYSYLMNNLKEIFSYGNTGTFDKEMKTDSIDVDKELGIEAHELINKSKEYFVNGQNSFNSFNYREAIEYIKKSIDILPTMSAYLSLGTSYSFLYDNESAENTFDLGYKLSIKRNSNKFRAAFLGNLGLINTRKNKFNNAIKYLEEALNIHEQLKDSQGKASDYGNLGIVYEDKKDYQNSLIYLDKALKEFAKLKDKKSMAIQQGNIGNVYYDLAFNINDSDKLENPDSMKKALAKFKEVLSVFLEIDYKVGVAAAYRNMGKSSDWLGDYPATLEYYRNSYHYYEGMNNTSQLAKLSNDMGVVLRSLNRTDEALGEFQKATELKHDYADAWYNGACTYVFKGDTDKALTYLAKAIELDPSLKEYAKGDEELKSLINNPVFRNLVK